MAEPDLDFVVGLYEAFKTHLLLQLEPELF